MSVDIHVPKATYVNPQFRLSQMMWEDFLWDPCIAAKVIMGLEFDAFQQNRLRYMWFMKELEDHSSFSTGKTLVNFCFCNLRCILIPDHECAVYYPTFENGKKAFWPEFDRAKKRSEFFRAQLGRMDELGEKSGGQIVRGGSGYSAFYKNGNTLYMPAPGHKGDGETQASLRFNTIIFDEWPNIDGLGQSINKQLKDRATRQCFNQHHPIWGNKTIFTAPPRSKMHPSHRRHADMLKEARSGSPDVAVITYSFKDLSNLKSARGKSYAAEYRMLSQIKSKLRSNEERPTAIGIWEACGKGWYSEASVERAVSLGGKRGVVPVLSKANYENLIYGRSEVGSMKSEV